MSLSLHPELETKRSARAQAEDLSVELTWSVWYALNRAAAGVSDFRF
jgi:hypothetical protein